MPTTVSLNRLLIILLISTCSLVLITLLLINFWQYSLQRQETLQTQLRTAEGSITHMLESLDVSMRALSDQLLPALDARAHTEALERRLQQSTAYTPHIRQLVLSQNQRILASSLGDSDRGQLLDFNALGIPEPNSSAVNPRRIRLDIGPLINSRYLPLAEADAGPQPRYLIPLLYPLGQAPKQGNLQLILALSAESLQDLIREAGLSSEQVGLFTLSHQYSLLPGFTTTDDERLNRWHQWRQQLLLSGAEEQRFSQQTLGLPSSFAQLRLSPRAPLVLIAEESLSDHLRSWLAETWVLLLILSLLILATVILAVFFALAIKQRLAVQQQLRLLNRALDQSPNAVVITDRQRRIVYINQAFSELFGYAPTEVLGHSPSLLKSEQTPAQTFHDLDEHLHKGETWHGEFVNRRREGELLSVACSISTLTTDGEASHHIGVMQDISAQKRAEQEIRIAAKAFDIQEGLMITDAAQRILRVNQTFTSITGYRQQDVEGYTPAILKSGRHDASFYLAMQESLNSTGFWEGEIWNRKKNGEIYPEWLMIRSVTDEQGAVLNYIGSFTDITQRKAQEARIHQLAFYDPLTHLPNRRLLSERLQHALQRRSRRPQYGALILLDLDHFKLINDTQGHDKGDALLGQMAQRLSHCVRREDTVARMGGDEFVVLLEELSDHPDQAWLQVQKVAMKILVQGRTPFTLGENEFRISASLGVCLFNSSEHSADELIKQADIALYEAKHAGRDRYCLFSTPMQEKLAADTELERALHLALQDHQLSLHVQPQYNGARSLIGAEVLLRWPERSDVSTSHFIALAEHSDLILQIDAWVLEYSCQLLKQWQADLPSGFQLSINVSTRQFMQPDFAERVDKLLRRYQLAPALLRLEITENLLISDLQQAQQIMQALCQLGVELDLDDFGTGFSSLAYLKRLPLKHLKIDRSFVQDLPQDSASVAIARASIQLANNLGMQALAEGVENQAQFELLQQLGCHGYQGYWLARPMPPAAFLRLLRDSRSG